MRFSGDDGGKVESEVESSRSGRCKEDMRKNVKP